MKRFLATILTLGLIAGTGGSAAAEDQAAAPTPPPAPARSISSATADHMKFDILKKSFSSGPEVTEACVSCHTEADNQIMHSIHFEWTYESDSGQTQGKSKVINAFCGNVAGNEPRCTSCHAGYGWDDMSTTSVEAGAVPDCLVCHDRSGQYTKSATGAGHPPLDPVKPGTSTITGAAAWPVDLAKAAQSVGMPGRDNCGNCHFYGGGGDNVKHGDLSSALYAPSTEVDVHMSPDGLNFTCSTCHVEDRHNWAGSRYDTVAKDATGRGKPGAVRTAATCESCHDSDPHPLNIKGVKLNDHTDKLACQSCHIPEFARGGVATKTYWDWSTAGRMGADGKPMHEANFIQSDGKELDTYLSTKGDFKWGENVVPYYAWFNGHVEYATGEEINPKTIVEVNRINGTPGGVDSRIWPFKRMEGRQAYDTGSNKLAYSHVWGPTTDTAFWTNFDWPKAIEAGMKAAGQDYSGSFDFVDTEMYWPITHMVAPARDALDCAACHAQNGRLDGIAAVYMPGTNPRSAIGMLGMALVALTILGVGLHIVLRLIGGRQGGTDHG
ncbi:octaheme c-type cytochrome, tetrathionate reductase family [Aliiroseovarius sediminilitoris]|uniref:Octaheme c-type cytochrome, tetrathionate reductase family n=1 Tax=Aliiroseovarius sediminilitoris TaxID=1173584 RepID=A0A1I0PUZ8_9RHOB|nr:tetrathionate reductase family octaheme c-type cytochrome [Aliiroseovarius sediminilitoris]SEW18333.1 octaheme c-type cytochrome, tetrathionate reductase family [Aliiroseovarius sediminilitoris]